MKHEFQNTVFVPSDTSYTRRMEEIFKNYLYRLVYYKGSGLQTNKDFSNTLQHIQAYPDIFVREYLLCFLVTDHNEIWNRRKTPASIALIQQIKNPLLKNGLKKIWL
uniref:hypothetical protein n=1 Tax=Pedobacter schmidteae TaxID=2201271 RepID=UPI0013CF3E16|nr:hypothetical protein [Pedobacter schmidteae]